MKLLWGMFAVTLLAMPRVSEADVCSYQYNEAKNNGDTSVIMQIAKEHKINGALCDKVATTSRQTLAYEMAVGRALTLIAKGAWGASEPSMRNDALKILSEGAPYTEVASEPLLDFNVSVISPHNQSYQLKGGQSSVTPNGSTQTIVRPPNDPIRPVSLAAIESIPSDNNAPDINHLPFKLLFLVELKTKDFRCSGALIASSAVLTAKHCVEENGVKLDGSDITVHTVDGAVESGAPGPAWTLDVPPDEETYARYADVAILKLKDPFPSKRVFPRIATVQSGNLWVILAGFGYTDFSELQYSGWNISDLAMQLVNFTTATTALPSSAAIPWDNTTNPASQCAGDSGGPVFVIGADNLPYIVGILSRDELNSPNSVAACRFSTNATFVNLGNPFVKSAACDALRATDPCVEKVSLSNGKG